VAIAQQSKQSYLEQVDLLKSELGQCTEKLHSSENDNTAVQEQLQKFKVEHQELTQKNKSYEQALKVLYLQLRTKDKQLHTEGGGSTPTCNDGGASGEKGPDTSV